MESNGHEVDEGVKNTNPSQLSRKRVSSEVVSYRVRSKNEKRNIETNEKACSFRFQLFSLLCFSHSFLLPLTIV